MTKGWNPLHNVCPDFSLHLLSGEVENSCQNLEPVDGLWADRFHQKSHRWWAQILIFLASDYKSVQSEEIKHIWYFEDILGSKQDIVYICHYLLAIF